MRLNLYHFLKFLLISFLSFSLWADGLDEEKKPEHLIKNVPFFPQEKHQCGPASLAGVLNYWGIKVSPEEIAKTIYSRSAKGTLSIDLVLYVREKGLLARPFQGTMEELRNHIDAGYPLIVFVDYGFGPMQINHFMVVVGYRQEGLIVNSGQKKEQFIKKRKFLRAWKKNRYWTLLIEPKKVPCRSKGSNVILPPSNQSSLSP